MKAVLLLILGALVGSAALADSGPATLVLKLPHYYKAYEFIHLTDANGKDLDSERYSPTSLDSVETLCDLDVHAKANIGKTISCFSITDEGSVNFLKGKLMKAKESYVYLYLNGELPQPEGNFISIDQHRFYHGIFLGVSPERPLYLVYDMEAGYWSYGFSLSRLRSFSW